MEYEHVRHEHEAEPVHAEPVYDGPSSDELLWGTFAHIGPILLGAASLGTLGILAPLVIWLVKKDESEFVDDQGKEALNFQITVLVAGVIGAALLCVGGLGLVILIPLALLAFVLPIIAGIKAASGDYYRYPLNVRFIS